MICMISAHTCGRNLFASASEAENCENLFAAGDVCAYPAVKTGQRVRIEHWDVAMQQGRTAASNMLGMLGKHLETETQT